MKIIAKLCLSLVLIASISLISLAKNNTTNIKGKVVNIASNEPVSFASVAIEGTSIGAVTNFEGEFEILNVPAGHCHIIASCVGFRSDKKHFDVKLGQANTLTFKINEDFIGLDQVVVTADRNQVSRKDAPVVVNSIGTKLLENTAASTMADGLIFSPGLRVENDCNNCGFSQVRMNGLEGPYTQILINSRPIFSGLAGVYGLEHIPPSMIQRIEVVRGGGSALFGGNAIAGTINVITKDPVSNSFKVGAKYSSVGTGVSASEKPAGDIMVDFNASIVSDDNKSGIFLFGMKRNKDAWDANKDGFSDIVELKNLSAGFNAFHRLSDLSKLNLEYHVVDEFRRGGDQLDLPAHMSLIAEQVKHNINSGSITLDQFFSKERISKLSLYASAQHIDRASYYGAATLKDENGIDLPKPIFDNSAYGATKDLAISAGVQFFSHSDNLLFAPADITLGFENVYNKLKDKKLAYNDYKKDIIVPTTIIANQNSNTIGAYAQSKWDLGFASFLLGARMDSYKIKNTVDNSEINNTVISPRANMLFKLDDAMQLRLSYARGFRAPQIFDEDLHIEASAARRVIHKLSENLKAESSNSYTVSYDVDKSFGKVQTYFLAEGFYTDLNDSFVNEYSTNDEDGNLVAYRKNSKGAIVKGINLEFKIAPSYKLDFQMGMTLQSSKYKEKVEQGDLTEIITDKMLRTPNHYGYFAMNWKPLHEFTTTLSGSYSGSMDLIHFGVEKDINGVATGDQLVKSGEFMDVGINFAYHFDLGGDVKLEFDLGMKNIFNSFQDDFDKGAYRDASWVYGPLNPRTIYFGIKLGNLL
ncbi:TonB-dependent receptor [Ancylomarina euxinus]|uniref:TonB-dependent receptor n=1 Tax=Ancylomarina euxinus TaxID=2283627 RepID=A0A425XYT6_9BACT|nr:TonB-dependent receptor [Ancylomarina euxinus]MCZ4695650.1 TonB-dependent receptor [Ancylomarina euxinus]MUP16046.1 TonB-dependent receptor [Ancylomarina euxinus]RRG20290.1 TonB-dependent receptor [Ancylomarina euxinus]